MRAREYTHSLLDALTCGLSSKNRSRRVFLMLFAYIDDSGTDRQGPAVTLAGWAASEEKWRAFSDAWQAVLDMDAPTKLAYFKMSEANSLKFEFKGWTEEQRNERVARLLTVIQEHVLYGMYGLIYWDDFREVQKLYPQLFIHEYSLLFSSVIAEGAYRAQSLGEKIEFIFDEQGTIGDNSAEAFDLARRFIIDKQFSDVMCGKPIHRCDKEVLPLQAADLLAWHIRRVCYESERSGAPELGAVMGKFSGIPMVHIMLDRDELMDYCRRMSPDPWDGIIF